jgi:hypothetical protein
MTPHLIVRAAARAVESMEGGPDPKGIRPSSCDGLQRVEPVPPWALQGLRASIRADTT